MCPLEPPPPRARTGLVPYTGEPPCSPPRDHEATSEAGCALRSHLARLLPEILQVRRGAKRELAGCSGPRRRAAETERLAGGYLEELGREITLAKARDDAHNPLALVA